MKRSYTKISTTPFFQNIGQIVGVLNEAKNIMYTLLAFIIMPIILIFMLRRYLDNKGQKLIEKENAEIRELMKKEKGKKNRQIG